MSYLWIYVLFVYITPNKDNKETRSNLIVTENNVEQTIPIVYIYTVPIGLKGRKNHTDVKDKENMSQNHNLNVNIDITRIL